MVWGGVSPLQSTRGSGGASWAPPAGSGAEPRPKTDFGVFWRPQNAHFCTYMTKSAGDNLHYRPLLQILGGRVPPWSTPMLVLVGLTVFVIFQLHIHAKILTRACSEALVYSVAHQDLPIKWKLRHQPRSLLSHALSAYVDLDSTETSVKKVLIVICVICLQGWF